MGQGCGDSDRLSVLGEAIGKRCNGVKSVVSSSQRSTGKMWWGWGDSYIPECSLALMHLVLCK